MKALNLDNETILAIMHSTSLKMTSILQLNVWCSCRKDNQQFGIQHTVGQLAARLTLPHQRTSFYTNVGTAFRAPVVGQMISEPSWWGGNPDLKPEESLSYEAGFDHAFNESLQVLIASLTYQTNVYKLMLSN